jgi:hypothetical protein
MMKIQYQKSIRQLKENAKHTLPASQSRTHQKYQSQYQPICIIGRTKDSLILITQTLAISSNCLPI